MNWKRIRDIAGWFVLSSQVIGALKVWFNLIPFDLPVFPFKVLPKVIKGKNPFNSGMNPNYVPNPKVLTSYIDEYASDDVEVLAKFWDRRSSIQEE